MKLPIAHCPLPIERPQSQADDGPLASRTTHYASLVPHHSSPARAPRSASGFTILEVIIACTIFFMVAFAVLELVTSGLVAARSLQQRDPDPGLVAAALSLTNKLIEGSYSGDFEDIAPDMYPGYQWEYYVEEVGSNRLFQVDIIVHNPRKKANPATLQIQLWRPESPAGAASGGIGSR
jgi:hypothetical protein